jgi:uncharacterized membrane protein (UPF0127 family)
MIGGYSGWFNVPVVKRKA